MQCCQPAGWRDFEYCARDAIGGTALKGCPVEVAVARQNDPPVRLVTVSAVGKGAEAIKRSHRACGRHFEYCARAVGPSSESRSIQITVGPLNQRRVHWSCPVSPVKNNQRLEGIRAGRDGSKGGK